MSIEEACGERVQAFVLECKPNGAWRPFYTGKIIGEDFKAPFSPVKSKQFRLNILNATEGPTLWELRFLPTAKSLLQRSAEPRGNTHTTRDA